MTGVLNLMTAESSYSSEKSYPQQLYSQQTYQVPQDVKAESPACNFSMIDAGILGCLIGGIVTFILLAIFFSFSFKIPF